MRANVVGVMAVLAITALLIKGYEKYEDRKQEQLRVKQAAIDVRRLQITESIWQLYPEQYLSARWGSDLTKIEVRRVDTEVSDDGSYYLAKVFTNLPLDVINRRLKSDSGRSLLSLFDDVNALRGDLCPSKYSFVWDEIGPMTDIVIVLSMNGKDGPQVTCRR
ncbi:hypothetical protein [Aeromonas diversa]|uniref:hypothetical protein n=1 Tax=Aeromonas diversa TaxID=502790 RepID=UPI0034632DA1